MEPLLEPLHDLKGIITLLLEVLPSVISDASLKKQISNFCTTCRGMTWNEEYSLAQEDISFYSASQWKLITKYIL